MFPLIEPQFWQMPAEQISRGHVISFEGSRVTAALVEWCEDKGANVVVKMVGEPPVIVSKDRVVAAFSTHY
ncbi:hypothetical protein NMR56_000036 [Vibrio cholerae]|uniref:hypothetical protein n=1 Tax=Vibrio cholerae TaxID=666 RepID=UPI0006E6400E|nr:hypothetical protein [Vibrio cholerae]KQA29323.1 hypothetical protein F546_06435 [Vibrio paracholerae 877-163]EGQ8579163.1 hypothetical protein [Vibrio cholerae]EGQ9324713.1 hypothetical protein [Vibrio cholerae]EGR0792936.1 hypothetical protein [Vibrio cholerae]EGR0805501.1 hypothetical protein [Vibrio cholerae]